MSGSVGRAAVRCVCSLLKRSPRAATHHQLLSSSTLLPLPPATSLAPYGLAGFLTGFLWPQQPNGIFPMVLAAKPLLREDEDQPDAALLKEGRPVKSRAETYNFIADVVERTAPAVVFIEIQGRHPFTGAMVPVSNGSGFIVEENGLIITNAHVIANKSSVVVKLYDGRMFTGQVENIDVVADLATIRIPCQRLPTLKLGSAKPPRPGEWVVAMGSPLSLSNTITAGVISSVSRGSKELGLANKNIDYIQTDASITFGNSGGPLVNLDGEVIGINTMKVTAGISFAIPSNAARDFLERTKKENASGGGWFGGKKAPTTAQRYYMGITMLTLTPSIILELQQRQQDFPPEVTHGVIVWKVVVGSPAYNGGLRPGDIVTTINGDVVKSVGEVYKALESGHELGLTVLRKRQKLRLTVVPEVVTNS